MQENEQIRGKNVWCAAEDAWAVVFLKPEENNEIGDCLGVMRGRQCCSCSGRVGVEMVERKREGSAEVEQFLQIARRYL